MATHTILIALRIRSDGYDDGSDDMLNIITMMMIIIIIIIIIIFWNASSIWLTHDVINKYYGAALTKRNASPFG